VERTSPLQLRLGVPQHKGNAAFIAAPSPQTEGATSSVGFRRQLPLEGKPSPRQKAPSPRKRKSLPLDGKVPNASEADEVERTSSLQLRLGVPQHKGNAAFIAAPSPQT